MVVNSLKPLSEIQAGGMMALPGVWTFAPWASAWSTAQIGVVGNANARRCYNEAKSDGTNADSCDKSLANEMLLTRDLAATYVNRAVVRTNAGKLEAALEDLARAESLRPDFGEIYSSRGNIYFYQNSFEDAVAEHDRGIRAGMKKLHAAHYNRGLALEKLGRYAEAKEAYLEAVMIAPQFQLARMRLMMF